MHRVSDREGKKQQRSISIQFIQMFRPSIIHVRHTIRVRRFSSP